MDHPKLVSFVASQGCLGHQILPPAIFHVLGGGCMRILREFICAERDLQNVRAQALCACNVSVCVCLSCLNRKRTQVAEMLVCLHNGRTFLQSCHAPHTIRRKVLSKTSNLRLSGTLVTMWSPNHVAYYAFATCIWGPL